MKKVFLALVLIVGLSTFAQERGEKRERLSPEQQTELQVKKMTVDLDLNASQQKDIKALLLEQAKKRESKKAEMKANKEKGEKPSKDERFEMKNRMLDEQMAMKTKMKSILNETQMKKWEELKKDKMEVRRGKMSKRRDKKEDK